MNRSRVICHIAPANEPSDIFDKISQLQKIILYLSNFGFFCVTWLICAYWVRYSALIRLVALNMEETWIKAVSYILHHIRRARKTEKWQQDTALYIVCYPFTQFTVQRGLYFASRDSCTSWEPRTLLITFQFIGSTAGLRLRGLTHCSFRFRRAVSKRSFSKIPHITL